MKSSKSLLLPGVTILIIPFGVGVGVVSRKIKKDFIRDVFNSFFYSPCNKCKKTRQKEGNKLD